IHQELRAVGHHPSLANAKMQRIVSRSRTFPFYVGIINVTESWQSPFGETPKRARSPRANPFCGGRDAARYLTAALTRIGSRARTRSCSRAFAHGDGSLGWSGSR